MKNAIKILSIIYIPLIAIQILAYLITSISFFLAAANPNIYPNVDAQSATYVFTVYAIVFLFVTLGLVPGLILNIILLKKSQTLANLPGLPMVCFLWFLAPPSQVFLLSSMAQLKKSQRFILKKYIFKINKTIL